MIGNRRRKMRPGLAVLAIVLIGGAVFYAVQHIRGTMQEVAELNSPARLPSDTLFPEIRRPDVNRVQLVNSTDLRRTSVVAVLDSPIPRHRNIVWCATFQMAWDQFKRDIARGPVKVLGAEAFADRLNSGQFPLKYIDPESYYVAAGSVRSGIIERIGKEMTRRFPSEPGPLFDDRYGALPDVLVAYAYLKVDIGFTYPFCAGGHGLPFVDSNGVRKEVTWFSTAPDISIANAQFIREQVEVLSSIYDPNGRLIRFAVDLCKDTRPYQVVLASVPQEDTLNATLAAAEKDAAVFRSDADYKTLRNLRPIDALAVPDVLFKVRHSFSELIGKPLSNPGLGDQYFFEAMQTVDFSLSRTGVIMKSQAMTGTAAGRGDVVEKPRSLCFNEPFLIYARKRQAGARPFFVMWVDNVELMRPFPATEQSAHR